MIKVTVGEQKTQDEKPYPKIMTNQDGELFYFVREKYGLPLNGKGWDFDQPTPADYTKAIYHKFADYNEPITLQNA